MLEQKNFFDPFFLIQGKIYTPPPPPIYYSTCYSATKYVQNLNDQVKIKVVRREIRY
jgi:hypothetical protein